MLANGQIDNNDCTSLVDLCYTQNKFTSFLYKKLVYKEDAYVYNHGRTLWQNELKVKWSSLFFQNVYFLYKIK